MAGVELDPSANLSYAANFHSKEDETRFSLHASPKDICKLDPVHFLNSLGHKTPTMAVDLIVGGPPCPSYTRVGRAKLREIHQHPEAFLHDPRGKLYLHYLRMVKSLQPVALLMENVPDILNYGGINLGEEISTSLEAMGYVCAYTLLNAASYGVPQLRERFFLVAIHEKVGAIPVFPKPEFQIQFPTGYHGSRRVALKNLPDTLLWDCVSHYVEALPPTEISKSGTTVGEAIGDLPALTMHLNGEDRRGARRFETGIAYRTDIVPSEFARLMREWPGFASDGLIFDHVTRCLTERDYRLFGKMKAGDDYPKAIELAERFFARALSRAKNVPLAGTPEFADLRARYVPPYDVAKFPNKWRKLDADEPSRTLMAHLGKDTYSHIHYDSEQARVISVREAARLQSFPDGFVFAGTMNPAFRQIGNSVPPLLSFALAESLLNAIGAKARAHSNTEISGPKFKRELMAKAVLKLAS